MLRIVRKLANRLGFDVHRYEGVRGDADTYRRIYPPDVLAARRFYNIGAGTFRHPFWTNVDKLSEWYSTLQNGHVVDFDLLEREPLPFDSGTAEIFYSSHTIEHIDDGSALHVFREIHRCLKPGGLFRVVCPNVDLDYRAWQAQDRSHFYWIDRYSKPSEIVRAKLRMPMNQASIEQLFLYHVVGSASELHADGVADPMSDHELREVFANLDYEAALDACVRRGSLDVQRRYPGNHINWWNPGKAVRMLKLAGFERVLPSAYGQSTACVLRNTDVFDRTHPRLSLYVEAIR